MSAVQHTSWFVKTPQRTPRASSRSHLSATGRDTARAAFTLVELLVVVAIILVLMGLMGSAVSAARTSHKKQATQMLIAKIDAIIQQQYSTYASRNVPNAATSAARGVDLRRMATGDLPDSWADVAYMASNPSAFTSAPQRAYVAMYNSGTATGITPTPAYGDAECLFMIVMQGGIANCIDCGELKTTDKGDTDGDGFFEFLDAWGQPIRYVLWPAGLELPAGSGTKFFSTNLPFSSTGSGRTMGPLIFSGGPDGPNNPYDPQALPLASFVLTEAVGHLQSGTNCGVPPASLQTAPGAPRLNGLELPGDNITNFDTVALK
jgi:prepilin-type N-terminal cleavage/methylation domain-containing protein